MRCGQCPAEFCQYRRTDGECMMTTNVFTTPDTRTCEIVEDKTCDGVDVDLVDASRELVEAVEKYICPKKGEFLSRIGLLVVLRKVKKIIYEGK